MQSRRVRVFLSMYLVYESVKNKVVTVICPTPKRWLEGSCWNALCGGRASRNLGRGFFAVPCGARTAHVASVVRDKLRQIILPVADTGHLRARGLCCGDEVVLKWGHPHPLRMISLETSFQV